MGEWINMLPSLGMGAILRDIREQEGITQRELAAALGKKQSFVSYIDIGKRRLTVDMMRIWLLRCGYDLEFRFVPVKETAGGCQ